MLPDAGRHGALPPIVQESIERQEDWPDHRSSGGESKNALGLPRYVSVGLAGRWSLLSRHAAIAPDVVVAGAPQQPVFRILDRS